MMNIVKKSVTVTNDEFWTSLKNIAIPITIQSVFQASLSVIDEIMVGQLGTASIAGIGLGSKFAGLFSVTVTAVITAASIMISQYYGNKDASGVNDSLKTNAFVSMIVALLFTAISMLLSTSVLRMYSKDIEVINIGAIYLKIVAIGFIPMTITLLFSALMRNIGYAKYTMICSVISVICNTVLNYILIFGKMGFKPMGYEGAAIATTISRAIECIFAFAFYLKIKDKTDYKIKLGGHLEREFIKKASIILTPMLLNEFMWGLGENIYGVIYGRIGTNAAAAMSVTTPIQSLLIGLFTGLSAAAGLLVGNELGSGRDEEAYSLSKKFIKLGIIGSLIIAVILVALTGAYVRIYDVEASVARDTRLLLYVFAGILFVKVTNMIMSGGIIRSGGKTKYTLFLDILGTWGCGIPLGLIAAFIFKLPVYYVYLILSMEEVVRMIVGFGIFSTKKWMNNITK